jgi:hypothetical protein
MAGAGPPPAGFTGTPPEVNPGAGRAAVRTVAGLGLVSFGLDTAGWVEAIAGAAAESAEASRETAWLCAQNRKPMLTTVVAAIGAPRK